MPKVSVVIPTYNRANLVRRGIKSVLDQTYQHFELIVVDDASTDNTEKIVKNFNDKRVRYICHTVNRGVASAENTGIIAASGEYIAFLDHDDEWHPQYLEYMINLMDRERKETGLAFCPFYHIDPDTGVVLNIRKQQRKQKRKGSAIGFLSRQVVRKEVFEKVGMFDESLKCLEDAEMSFRILSHYRAVYLDKPLVSVYRTKGSLSSDVRKRKKDIRTLLDKHSEIMNSEELADWYISLANLYFIERNYKNGRQNLIKAMRIDPFNSKILLFFLASFLGYGVYFNLNRLLNLNLTKVVRILRKYIKGLAEIFNIKG